jgi:transposase InsO family protein
VQNNKIPAIQHWSLEARDAGYKMQLLHMDSDSVFKCKEFVDWLAMVEINSHFALPGQHWANTLIERFLQTVGNNAQTMLNASGLPFKFWFFALSHAVDLHNKLLTKFPTFWSGEG